jgi:hypothetical protein
VGIRSADHAAPSIRKTWHQIPRQATVNWSVYFIRGLWPRNLVVFVLYCLHLGWKRRTSASPTHTCRRLKSRRLHRPRKKSGVWSQDSHRGGLGSSPSHVMWVFWRKWQLGRFSSSTSVSLTTNCSTSNNRPIIRPNLPYYRQ